MRKRRHKTFHDKATNFKRGLINRQIFIFLVFLWRCMNLLSNSSRVVLSKGNVFSGIFSFTRIERDLCCYSCFLSLLSGVLLKHIWVEVDSRVLSLWVMIVSYFSCAFMSCCLSFSWNNSFSWVALILSKYSRR